MPPSHPKPCWSCNDGPLRSGVRPPMVPCPILRARLVLSGRGTGHHLDGVVEPGVPAAEVVPQRLRVVPTLGPSGPGSRPSPVGGGG